MNARGIGMIFLGALVITSCGSDAASSGRSSDHLLSNLSQLVDETCRGEVQHQEETFKPGPHGDVVHTREAFYLECGGEEAPLRRTSLGFTRFSSDDEAESAVSSFARAAAESIMFTFIDFGGSTALLWEEVRVGDESAAYQHRY